ncbi:hypothetical protein MA16_Dca028309 [Dendrobium catenatum]|uniref:Uncharacterized protein n=1 Tax=Dendrobium catenatum TaxID=906689 RepID=A0A2I0VHI9_9ASPA|nr:hypothetical protein MA16_Dca028309 [Dendrobium catenatum]
MSSNLFETSVDQSNWMDGDGNSPCEEARNGFDELLNDLNVGSNIQRELSHGGSKRSGQKSRKK